MQMSSPLALHLHRPSGQHLEGREIYTDGTTVADYHFIDQLGERGRSTVRFASILRALYDHPDWSQIHAFCTKRYSRFEDLSTRGARVLEIGYPHNRTVKVRFNTDPSLIGLPKSLIQDIGIATQKARHRVVGPDPLFCATGPAISVAMGGGAFMDLIYAGNAPGAILTHAIKEPLADSKRCGRRRTLQEWRDIWAVIGDWVYENEATTIAKLGGTYSYKGNRSVSQRVGGRVPRENLQTDPIRGADAIRDMFEQISSNVTHFQGIECDFLALEEYDEIEWSFEERFGPKPADRTKYAQDLLRSVQRPGFPHNDIMAMHPARIRRCPATFQGLDWEKWFLSIDGGSVVVVDTVFQVRPNSYGLG